MQPVNHTVRFLFILIESGLNNVVAQRLAFGDTSVTLINSLLFVLITQLVGYGLAGLMRRFLVRPTAMMWPSALAQVAFFNAFHDSQLDDKNSKYFKSMSRYSAFWVSFAFMFFYSWIPSYLAPALSLVAVLCLIPGLGRTAYFLGSGSNSHGPGILAMTFDWTQITSNASVYNPWSTTLNFAIGGVISAWFIGPLWNYTKAFGMPEYALFDSYP